MISSKRMFDIVLAILLFVPLLFLAILVALVVLLVDGRPIFYVARRAKSETENFNLYKFRTMKTDAADSGASGGHKLNRITRTGHFLRRVRLDEVPQIWNILRGDMCFVGPRPPLPIYVRKYPDIYKEVLKTPPGLTGLASIYFNKHEEYLLRDCGTSEENEQVYVSRCIPRKAYLDMLYARNQSVCMDIWLVFATVFRRLR